MRQLRLCKEVTRQGLPTWEAPFFLNLMSDQTRRTIMLGRREFGLTGLSALAMGALGGKVLAEERGDSPHHGEHDAALQACAKACSDCQRWCNSCSTHCAHQVHAGHKEHITTLMTCQDCADFCAAASQIAARGGPFATLICQSCAEACARCAAACEKFLQDKHMAGCAAECRRCEKACREMAGVHVHR